jgi:YVTN family beta-propeller protein
LEQTVAERSQELQTERDRTQAILDTVGESVVVTDLDGGVAIDTGNGNAFFTNSASNNVSVIGGNSNNVVATVAARLDPFGIAADPGTGRIFAANRGSDNLTVFLNSYAP